LSERVAQLSIYCPRLSEYKKLFQESLRLQQAISDFYAVVVVFCSKALKVVQKKGENESPLIALYYIVSKHYDFILIGITQFSKLIWKPFKAEFKEIEESLSVAKDEIIAELQLATEQAAHSFRYLVTNEIEENRILRLKQVAEIQENKDFRLQQTLALLQTQARQIQKIIKEEGNSFSQM
jgi:hypothetical protein